MEDMNNVRHQYGVLQNGEGSGGSEYGVYQNGDPVNGRTEYDEIRSRTPGSIFGKATADAHERADNWLAFIREQAQNTPDAYRDLMAIRDKENYDKANKRLQMRDTLESAIASTPDGEAMSQGMINYLNDKRGIASDGKNIQNGQIMQGGWNPRTGGFGFVMASVDDNGNVRYEPREMARNEIYGMMRSRPELFDASRTDALGQAIQKADTSYYAPGRLDGLANQYKVGRDRLMNDVRNAKDAMGAGYYGGVGGRSRVGGLRGGRTVEDEMKLIEARKNAPRFDKNRYDALMAYRNDLMYPRSMSMDGGYDYDNPRKLTEDQEKDVAAINKQLRAMLVGDDDAVSSGGDHAGSENPLAADPNLARAEAARAEAAKRAQGGAGGGAGVIRPTGTGAAGEGTTGTAQGASLEERKAKAKALRQGNKVTGPEAQDGEETQDDDAPKYTQSLDDIPMKDWGSAVMHKAGRKVKNFMNEANRELVDIEDKVGTKIGEAYADSQEHAKRLAELHHKENNMSMNDMRKEAKAKQQVREQLERGAVDGNYNTVLTDKQEAEYQKWKAKLPKNFQYEGDYDLRGYWLKYGNSSLPRVAKDGRVHLTDEFKKPNHETFSNESRYAQGDFAENAQYAGSWDNEGNYTPGKKKFE